MIPTRRRGGTALALPLLFATALAASLAACTFESPGPAPTATVSAPSSDPVVTPSADPLESVTTVVVRPDGLDLLDDAGATVGEVSYDDEAAAIVEALDAVFGAASEVEEFAGRCCEAAPRTTIYRWDGFEVLDDHMGHFVDGETWVDEDGPDTSNMNVHVLVDVPAVGDVAVVAVNGFQLGDDLAALAESVGQSYEGKGWEEIPVETGPELGPAEIPGEPNAYSVVVQVEGPDGEPRLIAPLNLGIGRV
ncbi:hypothetical protein ACFQ58_16805 [Agromyces sp. NPDC056523]|uniref:hypothetical protein n=1 Tax=Agromyces sp. NPDC056523 TaxID=3345850 RepID=UPI00366BE5E4